MIETFQKLLTDWTGSEVTVVNPESFKSTALGKALTFQSYKANVASVGEDVVHLTFSSVKGESSTPVEQFIPMRFIKRISLWGDEKIIHL